MPWVKARINGRVRFKVRVRVRVRVRAIARVRARVNGGDYFLRLHTPSSIVGWAI